VSVRAQGSDVPVYVARDRLDLQCCLFGRMYRTVLRLHNRSSAARKVSLLLPKHLAPFVEFTPQVG